MLLPILASALTPAQGSHDRCVIFETSEYGFGSNLFGLLMMLTLYGNDMDVYIDETAWDYKCGGKPSWQDFFSSAAPKPLSAMDSVLAAGGQCTRILYKDAHEKLVSMDPRR